MKHLICPISEEKINESVVRITAFWVVILTGLFVAFPHPAIPLYLAIDFYIRAFTKLRFSPLSRISYTMSGFFGLPERTIDKAPKVFAARVGLLFSLLILLFTLVGVPAAAISTAGVLILFAFLECGLNFCAGCWVYTYIVLPIYRNK
ncbi:MAG: DUF4395 domain-containing protein [Bacteroidales bacterium]|nr:DUF4395 domain-containing protein [Bacteroidales bacterium]